MEIIERPFGPQPAAILATEHWSLLATRSLIWNEAMSRATVFLTVLSASIVALALLADATGFGPQTTTLALVVLLLGIATYVRLVQINTEEFQLVLAMNRLRRAYLTIEPGLEPYFTTGHHYDERGLVTTYMLDRPSQARLWLHFLVNTPTIVATVDAALAAAIVVLVLHVVEAPRAALVASGVVAFLAVWGTLFPHAAAHPAPAPPQDAEVPHSAGGGGTRPLRSRGAAWVGSFGVGGLSRGLGGGDGRPASFLGSSPAGAAFNQGALVVQAGCRWSWVSAPRRSGRADPGYTSSTGPSGCSRQGAAPARNWPGPGWPASHGPEVAPAVGRGSGPPAAGRHRAPGW